MSTTGKCGSEMLRLSFILRAHYSGPSDIIQAADTALPRTPTVNIALTTLDAYLLSRQRTLSCTLEASPQWANAVPQPFSVS